MKRLASLLVAAGFALAGCGGTLANPATSPAVVATAQPSPGPGYAMPDHRLTPGAAGSDITQVCPHVAKSLEAARPDTATKARVFTAYRIPSSQRHLYVIDHLVSLSIDGANVQANLWPQPVSQARVKDQVEAVLHAAVCRKTNPVPLAAAQEAEATDWVTAPRALGLGS